VGVSLVRANRGNWKDSVIYDTGDIIAFRGSSYLVLRPNKRGEFPTQQNQNKPTAVYQILAAAGSPGPRGIDGTGVTSITGTAGQIDASAATGAVTLSLPSALTGINSVTSATGQALTLATLDSNANVVIAPNGTGYTTTTNIVGIGTGTPTSLLHVFGAAGNFVTFQRSGSGVSTNFANLYNTNTTDGNGALHAFSGDTTGAGATTTVFASYGARYTTHDNATFVGDLQFNTSVSGALAGTMILSGGANATLTGGAGNMTITAGTGNSRTLILRTTTSAGTATTALTLSATQAATFASTIGSDSITITHTGNNGLVVNNTTGNPLATFNASAADASVTNNAYITIQTASTARWHLGQSISAADGNFEIYGIVLGAAVVKLNKTTGAATFVNNLTLGGAYIGSTSTRSGPGACDVTTETTKVTSTGVLDALTIADGANGQIKRIVHDVDGGSFVLTPTTKTGFTTFTSTAAGETVTLIFVTTRGWMVVSNFGGVIA